MSTDINLPFITADQTGPKHLNYTLTRAKLEQLVDALIQRTIPPMQQALKDAGVKPEDVDEVILVGGQTRMPKVQQIVRDFFKKEPHKGVNPDEVVAIGAAIQGAVLTGEQKDVLLLDVTPLSLGIETLGGVTTVLIPRNTTIPTKKSEVFSTADDNQTTVEIHVLQGERELARDNRTIGRFHLTGIPPAPRGVPQVEVTFDIDANGILHVTAKDKATNKEQKITITHSSGLNKNEVEKMVADARSHEAEDKARRELVELKNRAEQMAYQMEKLVKENKEKISADAAKQVEDAVAELNKVREGEDKAPIEEALRKLEQASHRAAEEMYRAAGAGAGGPQPPDAGAPGAGAGPQPGGKKDDVVDAEFR